MATHGSRHDHRLDFAYTVAVVREDLGLTQTQMGGSIGVSQTVYNHYERGLTLPDNDMTVQMIADNLRLDRNRLFRIWERSRRDVARLGPPRVTRVYSIGGGSTASYRPKAKVRRA